MTHGETFVLFECPSPILVNATIIEHPHLVFFLTLLIVAVTLIRLQLRGINNSRQFGCEGLTCLGCIFVPWLRHLIVNRMEGCSTPLVLISGCRYATVFLHRRHSSATREIISNLHAPSVVPLEGSPPRNRRTKANAQR